MRKRGSIVCKLRPCLPKGPTNCTHMHRSDRSVTAAIFANRTYFVDTPCTMWQHAFLPLEFALKRILNIFCGLHSLLSSMRTVSCPFHKLFQDPRFELCLVTSFASSKKHYTLLKKMTYQAQIY
jgi:hypothetical protein